MFYIRGPLKGPTFVHSISLQLPRPAPYLEAAVAFYSGLRQLSAHLWPGRLNQSVGVFRVQGRGFRGLGFRVWGLGFRVWGFEFRVHGWLAAFLSWPSSVDHPISHNFLAHPFPDIIAEPKK